MVTLRCCCWTWIQWRGGGGRHVWRGKIISDAPNSLQTKYNMSMRGSNNYMWFPFQFKILIVSNANVFYRFSLGLDYWLKLNLYPIWFYLKKKKRKNYHTSFCPLSHERYRKNCVILFLIVAFRVVWQNTENNSQY